MGTGISIFLLGISQKRPPVTATVGLEKPEATRVPSTIGPDVTHSRIIGGFTLDSKSELCPFWGNSDDNNIGNNNR